MPIEFRCVQCGRLLRTGDETAGRQAQCPECGTIMRIPEASVSPSPAGPPPPSGCIPLGDSGTTPPSAGALPGAAPPHIPVTPTAMDIGDVFTRTWAIFLKNWGISLGVLAVVFLISMSVNMTLGLIPFLGGIVGGLFNIWLQIGETRFFIKTARGQPVEFGEIFTGGSHFLPILGASILFGLIFIGIFAVCIGPPLLIGLLIAEEVAVIFAITGGVVGLVIYTYVMLMLSQFYYLIIDRDMGVFESFQASREIMDGNKLSLFIVGILCTMIILLAILPCFLGLLVAAPFMALLNPLIYLTITGQPTAERNYAAA